MSKASRERTKEPIEVVLERQRLQKTALPFYVPRPQDRAFRDETGQVYQRDEKGTIRKCKSQ